MTNSPREPLSKILRDGRKACGLTQERAAAKIGVQPTTIARWEQDRVMPTHANLMEACRVYGISLEDHGLASDPRFLAARVAELEATIRGLAAHVGYPLAGPPDTF